MLNVRQFYFINFLSLFNYIYIFLMIYIIFYIFLNFLISLFYVLPDTRPIYRDRYASRPSESVIDTATLNHDSSRSWVQLRVECGLLVDLGCILWRMVMHGFIEGMERNAKKMIGGISDEKM